MTLQSRPIAVQGIGITSRHVALQGFVQLAERPADVIPYGYGPMVYPEKKKRQRDKDDDVLLFLLR